MSTITGAGVPNSFHIPRNDERIKLRPNIINRYSNSTRWDEKTKSRFVTLIVSYKKDQDIQPEQFKYATANHLNKIIKDFLKPKNHEENVRIFNEYFPELGNKKIVHYIEENIFHSASILSTLHTARIITLDSEKLSTKSEDSSADFEPYSSDDDTFSYEEKKIPEEEFQVTRNDDHNRSDVKPVTGPVHSRQTRSTPSLTSSKKRKVKREFRESPNDAHNRSDVKLLKGELPPRQTRSRK